MRWRYRETVLTLCTVAFFVTMVGRLAISPLIPDIAADLDISNALIGGALTMMWVVYALVQFPSGVLADLFGWTVSFGFLIALLPVLCGLLVGNRLLGLDYSPRQPISTINRGGFASKGSSQ